MTTLDDSSGDESSEPADVVTQIELSEPLVGRYRLFAEVGARWETSCVVTPVAASAGNDACPNLTRAAPGKKGRYVWTIEFAATSDSSVCFIRFPPPIRLPAR